MRRAERAELGWNEVDLGRTYDANYLQRLGAIAGGVRRTLRAREKLAQADIVYARNLDTALCALAAMKMTGLSRPMIYECLDIHRLMHRKDIVGFLMRRLERLVLAHSNLLVVSSPAFLRDYFDIRHAKRFTARLIENRILDHPALGHRPVGPARAASPLRIGWFGVLRCERSLRLLESIAALFKGDVEIVMAGYPDLNLRSFHERIRKHFNMKYLGRYKSPEDLAAIYKAVDVVWAGDFHDAGYNSRWLLPNRIYEGGYFATPAIAPQETETARWIEDRNGGFVVPDPLEQTLPELLHLLLLAPDSIGNAREALLAAPRSAFVQPPSEMQDIIRAAMTGQDNPSRADRPALVAQTGS
ncbi:MAG: glycosyl transferase family 1 [Oricola sp.]|nr:glycosyl transferase family 1 [Oricola sp.]